MNVSNEDEPKKLINGFEIPDRAWTNADHTEWARITDERNLEQARRDLIALRAEGNNLTNTRLEIQRKRVNALQAQLDRELEREEWREDKIEKITDRLITETQA